ncbi:MAG: hypothetical protein R2684_12955 [Pyrinomonadaceae bacterium]
MSGFLLIFFVVEALFEVIFEIIFEVVFEVVIEVINYLLFESVTGRLDLTSITAQRIKLIGFIFMGGMFGGASSFIFPTKIFDAASLIVPVVVISSFLAGLATIVVEIIRNRNRGEVSLLEPFINGTLFAFVFSISRALGLLFFGRN